MAPKFVVKLKPNSSVGASDAASLAAQRTMAEQKDWALAKALLSQLLNATAESIVTHQEQHLLVGSSNSVVAEGGPAHRPPQYVGFWKKQLEGLSCEAVANSVRQLVRYGHAKKLYEECVLPQLQEFALRCTDSLKRYSNSDAANGGSTGTAEPEQDVDVSLLIAQQLQDSQLVLQSVVRLWEATTVALNVLSAVFSDLSLAYIAQCTTDRSIRYAGGKLLCEALKAQGILHRCYLGFTSLVDEERRGNLIDRAMLQCVRDISLEAHGYFSQLEPMLLESTKRFYTHLSDSFVYAECLEGDPFFRKVAECIHQERDRAGMYFDSRSRAKMDEIVQSSLLTLHGPSIVANSFAALANENNIPALKQAWRLMSLKYVNKGDCLKFALREFVREKGKTILSSPPTTANASGAAAAAAAAESEVGIIPQLVALHQQAVTLVKSAFDSLDTFHVTVRDALEASIRLHEHKAAELLAKYLDGFLKEGASRDTTDADAEVAIERGVSLFSFMPAKDLFQEFYMEGLARRLMYQRCRSMDLERVVIRKLKEVVGSSMTAKLEGMMKDVAVCAELTAAFHTAQENAQETAEVEPASVGVEPLSPSSASSSQVETNFMILTLGYWPTFPLLRVRLPLPLQTLLHRFSTYYNGKYSGRQLKWIYVHHTVTLRCRFPKGKREITMGLLQALMLLAVDAAAGHSLTYKALCEQLADEMPVAVAKDASGGQACSTSSGGNSGAADKGDQKPNGGWIAVEGAQPDVVMALLAISAGSQKLLLRASNTNSATIDPAEVLSVNDQFVHRATKFRINQIQLRDAKQEAQETNKKVMGERTYVVDAALVRFMKSRRRAAHEELLKEVAQMLPFPTTAVDIKKRIEILIEREYLSRDSKDASVYEYLA